MATNRFLSTLNIQPALAIGSTAAARDSDWVSLKNYASVIFVVFAEAGAAADDVTIGIHQATSNSGADEKNVTARDYWRKQATTINVSGAYDNRTPSSGGDIVLEGSNQNILLFEVGADELDSSGGFKFVQATQDNGGATGKQLGMLYILCGFRYAVAPDQWPAVDA